MKSCMSCGNLLRGRQSKFCSRSCKNDQTNIRFQSYVAQQRRGRERKIRLIRLKGAKCKECGYSRNFSALEFHHEVPAQKEFALDLRSLSNRRWSLICHEAEKCILVCSNCHKEIHNPNCRLTSSDSEVSGDYIQSSKRKLRS